MCRCLILALLLVPLVGCEEEEPALLCEPEAWPDQQLRLLNRREYNATVRDLLPQLGGASCSADAGCDLRSQSCLGESCVADPCELVTFVLDTAQAGSAHVAGSFNGWSTDAWPMTWVPSLGLCYAKRSIPDGEHAYEFVLDGSDWLNDPGNAATTDDGFGGFNSVLNQQCAGAPPPDGDIDFAADFPVESRPERFAFDNNAEAGLVTATHVEHCLRAGEAITQAPASRWGASRRCGWASSGS